MDFYILTNKVATLLIGSSMNLIVNFEEPMDLSGAKANYLDVKSVNKSKTFIVTPRTKDFHSNLIFYNQKTKYMFYVKYSNEFSHDFVNIKNGSKDNSYSVAINKDNYRVLSGQNSTLFENKTNSIITVNGESFTGSRIFSKGIPLFIEQGNQKEVLFKGDQIWSLFW